VWPGFFVVQVQWRVVDGESQFPTTV